jgi:hypothetical protein
MRSSHQQIAVLIIAGASIALSGWATPAMARGEQDQRSSSEPASAGCSSYEKAPDGSWRQIPCISAGPGSVSTSHSQPTGSSEAAN